MFRTGKTASDAARPARLRGRALAATGALAATLAALGAAPPALAGLQQEYGVFKDCPVNSPGVTSCIVSTVTSGEFGIGSKTVPINKTVTLQGGVAGTTLVAAADGNTLSKTPLVLPGGLAGIELLPTLTEVTATAELAGTGMVDLSKAGGQGTLVSLPLKVKLDNTFLGSSCYIGSETEPVLLNLTNGTTNPPPPNKPIAGSGGTVAIGGHGKILKITNNSLVDNAFAAPGVNGCAGALALLIDPLVNIDAGLPAAAGHNTAIMTGAVEATTPRVVIAVAKLPELGRCEKVKGVREGPITRFHGGFNEHCIEENLVKEGEFEWTPGPGPKRKFTGTSGTVTLETVGKTKITCAGATSNGEYTGPKTATVTVAFSGCQRSSTKEPCQSAGAGSGQVVTSPLQGQLGFIQDEFTQATPVPSVGLDLKHEPTLLTAECGSSKEALSVGGSMIGQIAVIDKMVPSFTLAFKALEGKQSPEQFEGGVKDTLSESLGAGSPEQAGVTSKGKLTNEEKLQIKAEVE